MKKMMCVVTAVAVLVGSTNVSSAQNFGAMLGGSIGAAAGAAAGGKNAGGAALVGGIIGVAMGTILQQLNAAEQQKRQSAL